MPLAVVTMTPPPRGLFSSWVENSKHVLDSLDRLHEEMDSLDRRGDERHEKTRDQIHQLEKKIAVMQSQARNNAAWVAAIVSVIVGTLGVIAQLFIHH